MVWPWPFLILGALGFVEASGTASHGWGALLEPRATEWRMCWCEFGADWLLILEVEWSSGLLVAAVFACPVYFAFESCIDCGLRWIFWAMFRPDASDCKQFHWRFFCCRFVFLLQESLCWSCYDFLMICWPVKVWFWPDGLIVCKVFLSLDGSNCLYWVSDCADDGAVLRGWFDVHACGLGSFFSRVNAPCPRDDVRKVEASCFDLPR